MKNKSTRCSTGHGTGLLMMRMPTRLPRLKMNGRMSKADRLALERQEKLKRLRVVDRVIE